MIEFCAGISVYILRSDVSLLKKIVKAHLFPGAKRDILFVGQLLPVLTSERFRNSISF